MMTDKVNDARLGKIARAYAENTKKLNGVLEAFANLRNDLYRLADSCPANYDTDKPYIVDGLDGYFVYRVNANPGYANPRYRQDKIMFTDANLRNCVNEYHKLMLERQDLHATICEEGLLDYIKIGNGRE